jgi:flagellar basal-body rod protein FlgC
MDVFRALNVSAAGLSAQRTRMDVIAENLANSDTTVTPAGEPYRRKVVLLQAVDDRSFPAVLNGMGREDAGVRVDRVAESREPLRRVYQPDHPQAGPDGFVTLPNVNPLREMIDMLTSTRAYEANAAAFQATKSMGAKLLELLR